MNEFSTVIIGGGISGLTCARYLNDRGMSCLVLESSDALGGRVRTDKIGGFKLDRGFQALLTNYVETRKILDYNHLDLRYFEPGVLIKTGKGLLKIEDPFNTRQGFWASVFSPLGSWADRQKIRKLVREVSEIADPDFFEGQGESTLEFLKARGFSDSIIRQFFRPFLGGIFMENELETSSNYFRFILKQFSRGETAIPVDGIQAIPEQLVAPIPTASIRLNTKVNHIEGNKVFLEGGDTLTANRIVIATEAPAAAALLGEDETYTYQINTCTYYSAEYSPLKGQKLMVLNPERKSMVHNISVPTDLAAVYAPAGKALIAVSTQGLEKVDERNHAGRIKRELYDWFGSQVNGWKHLHTYHLPEAQVKYPAGTKKQELKLNEYLYRCGDYMAYPSLNAAMQTGREVAEMISEI